jgi:hypothetical protein
VALQQQQQQQVLVVIVVGYSMAVLAWLQISSTHRIEYRE